MPHRSWSSFALSAVIGCGALLAAPPIARAQLASDTVLRGLPGYAPINPLAASRSPLGFETYHRPSGPHWRTSVGLDYGSAIETAARGTSSVLVDAELLRLDLTATRDIGSRFFLLGELPLHGAYAGFLDGFLHWYHGLLGITIPEREARPREAFAYQAALPGGSAMGWSSSNLALGDVRLGGGVRYGRRVLGQTMVALTLPTATGAGGYGRGTVSASVLNTVHVPLGRRWAYGGSLSAGFTPTHGPLTAVQHTTFAAASSGLRYRIWGRQSLFANLFWHSPYYHDTGLPPLDRAELSLDFGWLVATRHGEWKIGMTEDMRPAGPAIDIVFRFGRSW